MYRESLAIAVVALLLSGCVHNDNHGVTVQSPTVPPSAAEYLKDGLLATKVRAQVVSVDIDAATQLGVQAHDGDVVLRGIVRTQDERRRIDQAVRKVKGVLQLHDEMQVNPKASSFSGGDFALAAHVTAALAAQTGVNAANIRVSAQSGTVTLRGHVPSQSIEATAVDTARHLSGVKRVINKLNVTH